MKLKINTPGLLFKTNNQIDTFMLSCLDELKNYTSHELRVMQQEIYNEFILAKTGNNIAVSWLNDPFIDVTGFPLKAFAVDRFRKYPNASSIVMSATTDLAPLRYIRTTRPMAKTAESSYQRYYKEFKLKKNSLVPSTFRFPSGALHLKNSQWKFYYAANDHLFTGKGKTEIYLVYGLIFLDDEPVRLLMNTSEFENLYRLLSMAVNEFSHDFTGHGSIDFVIPGTPERNIYSKEAAKNSDMCTSTLSEFCKHYQLGGSRGINFDEIRQLNLHMRLIEACFKRNGKYLAEVVENAHTFFDMLKIGTEKIVGDEGVQVYKYFWQVYMFCLARMLPVKYLPLVIPKRDIELLGEFIQSNATERGLNILSSEGSGLIVPKQGFTRPVASLALDDIGSYLDHRTIFMNVYNAIMK